MAIILAVIKWIGILIGIVLGIAVVLAACVVWVPVRYRAEAVLPEQGEKKYAFSVSFLFHLISIKKMDQKLTQVSKPVKRAIMGEVLEKLPMVFKSQDEVMETIRTRLFGCRDLAEQAVVVDLLNDWMRQEEW